MDTRRRSNIAGGLVLILIGGLFLAAQLSPEAFEWFDLETNWPLIVIGVGLLMLLIGLVSGEPGMAVPACIIGGIGGLLYWQHTTDNWDSWSYVWTLIPGFVGAGIILSGLLSGQLRTAIREGSGAVLVSLVLFAIFGSFLGSQDFAGPVLPILLIVCGVLFLIQTLFQPRQQ
jgi:hypothetical protein